MKMWLLFVTLRKHEANYSPHKKFGSDGGEFLEVSRIYNNNFKNDQS